MDITVKPVGLPQLDPLGLADLPRKELFRHRMPFPERQEAGIAMPARSKEIISGSPDRASIFLFGVGDAGRL
jgi:hypothetical protein